MDNKAQERIISLREEVNDLQKRLKLEYDPNERKKLELRIKVCELKIMIAGIE